MHTIMSFTQKIPKNDTVVNVIFYQTFLRQHRTEHFFTQI